MKQKLFRRIEALEKFSAAALELHGPDPDDKRKLEELWESVRAWHAVPANQQWLAEQPEDYLYNSVQQLREELSERASGYRAGVAA